MEIEVTLAGKDWADYQAHVEKRIRQRVKTQLGGFRSNIIFFLVLTAITMVMLNSTPVFHWPTAAFTASVFIFFGVVVVRDLRRKQQAMAPSEKGIFIGTHHFRFDDTGIHSRGEGYRGFHAWGVVQSIVREEKLVMVFLDTVFAFIFPIDQLEDPDRFEAGLREFRNAQNTG